MFVLYIFAQVFELMRKQEKTRQAEMASQKPEYQAVQAQHETVFGFSLFFLLFACNVYHIEHFVFGLQIRM